MKNLLNKGKVIVAVVSVFAVLAVSLLSMFAGVTFIASAEDATEEEATVTYPLNGTYDADFVGNDGGDGVYYADATGTETSKFTGFETDFITDAKGTGTQFDPYIIETANEFAAVVTGNLYDANGAVFSTQYVCFKVADNIKAFNLSNTSSTVDFSGDMTAKEVKDALEPASVSVTSGLEWKSVNAFMGQLDGNGVEVYGLKAVADCAGLIPHVSYNATVSNITVKNSYFYGKFASALVAYNNRPDGINHAIITYRNIVAHSNVIVSNSTEGEVIDNAGVLFGKSAVADGSEMKLSDSLVYDNIAKHESRDVTYGLVGNLHRLNSATIKNCIIMDSVPHTLYYGSNAFHNSTYNNVYTNKCDGKTWYNYDGNKNPDGTLASGKKYEYNYSCSETGIITAWFNGYNVAGTSFVNGATGYSKDLTGPMYNVDPTAVQGKTVINGLDEDRWTYHESGYPTPKVYKCKTIGAGVVSNSFFEGDGSSTTPYIITTAEEFAFMLMCDNLNLNFKLGKDIAINDTTAADWTKNAKTWFTSNDVPEFKGTLDGNFKTVSGIYYDGSQAGDYAGLIPVIGSPGSVSKLTVANSSLTAKSGAVGGVVGAVGEKALMIIKFDAVTVEDTVKFDGNGVKGGIVGHIGYSVAQFDNCISKSAGLFGDCDGYAKLNSCISVNNYPFISAVNIKAQNVYTDVDGDRLTITDDEGNEVDSIIVLDTELMKGTAAAANMTGLVFDGSAPSWEVVTDNFPVPTGAVAASEGVKGEPWTGAKATGFAGGSGSAEDPYQIETAEQLAYAIWKNNNGVHYVLTADIYLNDINSPMWADKIGCNQWYTQRTTQSYSNFKNSVLDGDGYVIYGLFFDHSGPQPEYVRTGLIPQLAAGSTLKNIAMSQAYINMNYDILLDHAGVLVGTIDGWNSNWPMDPKGASGNAILRNEPGFQANEPKFINCMADSSCYVHANQAGGLVGTVNGPILMENCAYYGSIKKNPDNYFGGALIGMEWGYGSTIRDCASLPQTCDQAIGGSGGQTWRTGTPDYIVIEWDDVYYFAKNVQRSTNEEIVRIVKPDDRIGDNAVAAMPGFDWVDEYDQEYYDADQLGYTDPTNPTAEKEGDATTWLAIDGGTPLPSIFAKHRSEEELRELSDTNFSPPDVTISFMTNTPEVVVDNMVGPMYSKLTLPTVSRDGYEFTGWYVFEDITVEYPKDYFPPRDLQLFAGWEATGVVQDFEEYTDTIWDYDSNYWRLNKPGAKGGYKNAYVRNGARSMHLLDTNTEPADFLINYEQMLEPGQAYTIKFWVATDKADNPATLLTLVHNEKPVYLDTQVAAENIAVVTGLKVGEWVQYSYSFTAQTKWVSIRATGGSSLYFDDIVIGKIDGKLNGGNLIGVGTGGAGAGAGSLSPNTGDAVTVAALISAIMACAVVAVISKKNLVEVID